MTLVETVAESVIAVRCLCPHCGKRQLHEVSDIWDGAKRYCTFCLKPFKLRMSDQARCIEELDGVE